MSLKGRLQILDFRFARIGHSPILAEFLQLTVNQSKICILKSKITF